MITGPQKSIFELGRRAQLSSPQQHASYATGRSSILLPLTIRKSRDGIVEICTLSHPDSRAGDPRWDCVDIRARWRLPSHSGCVEQTRLSVQPVREAE